MTTGTAKDVWFDKFKITNSEQGHIELLFDLDKIEVW